LLPVWFAAIVWGLCGSFGFAGAESDVSVSGRGFEGGLMIMEFSGVSSELRICWPSLRCMVDSVDSFILHYR
jgi:hypothetical protein